MAFSYTLLEISDDRTIVVCLRLCNAAFKPLSLSEITQTCRSEPRSFLRVGRVYFNKSRNQVHEEVFSDLTIAYARRFVLLFTVCPTAVRSVFLKQFRR
jgi:hypothetical protein